MRCGHESKESQVRRRCANQTSQKMEEQVIGMDARDITPAGKRKFLRWLTKQRKKNNQVNIALLIRNSPSEFKLFKMCRFIDKCWEARQDALGSSQTTSEESECDIDTENSTEDVCDGLSPESFKTVCMDDDSAQALVVENKDYSSMHKSMLSATQIKYNALTNKTKSRILGISNKRMDVPISQIIMDAKDEGEVIRFLEEIESREVVVNPEVRFWTCRVIR